MKQPNWSRVIEYLYQNDGYYYIPFSSLDSFDREDDITDNEATLVAGEKLRQDLNKIDAWEMGRVLNLLFRTGLVRLDIEEYGIKFRLTAEGLNLAHERQLRREQQEMIKSQTDATDTLADFTIILGLTALIQALASVVSAPRYSTALAAIYLVLLGVLWYKKDEWFHSLT